MKRNKLIQEITSVYNISDKTKTEQDGLMIPLYKARKATLEMVLEELQNVNSKVVEKSEVEQLREKLEKANQVIDEQQVKIESLQETIAGKEDQLEETFTALTAEINQLTENNRQLQQENQQLKEQVETHKTRRDKALKRMYQALGEVRDYKKINGQLQDQISSLELDLNLTRKKLEPITKETGFEIKWLKSQRENRHLQFQIKMLENKVKELSKPTYPVVQFRRSKVKMQLVAA